MKKTIKKFWGIALVVVMLSTLFVFATPAAAADPLQWNMEVGAPMGIPGLIYTQVAGSDIVDFAVSADGMTFYVALQTAPTAFSLMKGAMGGAVWTDLTSATNNRLRFTDLFGDYDVNPATADTNNVQFVAISPDNPDVVVVMGVGEPTSAKAWCAAASKDGGLNFSDMGFIQDSTGALPIVDAYDLDVSPISSGNIYYVGIAGDYVAGESDSPAIYYYNFGATVGAWHEAVNEFGVSVTPIGTPPPWLAGEIDNFRAVKFSTNFGSDFSVMALSEEIGVGAAPVVGALRLHVLSMASHKWDASLNLLTYPVVVDDPSATSAVSWAVNAASLTMGPDFMGIEEETLITFIGAAITEDAITEDGGIYRVDETSTVTTIRTAAINSVDFDGTTLVAGSYDTNNVWRTLDVTANSPTAASARSLKRIGIDDTGAVDMVVVHFAGANLFGAKRGDASALSKSTDYGNTWNDFTLMDSSNSIIDDIYMLPDGSAWYVAASDWNGAEGEASVYRMAAGVTQRVLCVDQVALLASAPQFMLRGIPGDPNVIYAGDKTGTSTDIYVSADGGVSRWSRKTTFPGAIINDMAVESATVVYVANGVMVYKSTNSGSLWSEGIDTRLNGGIFNMISLGDGKLLAGGNAGGITFSVDSGATWTPTLGVLTEFVPMYVAATGLGPTDTIFAASAVSLNVYRAPAAFFAEFKTMNVPAIAGVGEYNSGIQLVDGILYVLEVFNDGDPYDNAGAGTVPADTDQDATYLIHSLAPTAPVHPAALWGTRFGTNGLRMDTLPGSALKYIKTTTCSIKLYGIDNGSNIGVDITLPPDGVFDITIPLPFIYYYEDIVSPACAAPVLHTPADDALFEIVSAMLADAELVNFTWDRASSKITSYNLWVALDENFTQIWFVNNIASTGPAPVVSSIYGRGTFDPGQTYYWKVSTSTPFNGGFSETRSFTIAPSAATVPTINSPVNGATLTTDKPSFSWSPVTGTTKYEFQLDTLTTFTAPMFSEELATTAIMPNVTLEVGKTYFWRVRALEPVPSDWSSIANFTLAEPPPPEPTPTITVAPTPTFTVTIPPQQTIIIPTPTTSEVSPAYIWAIIIIGAVLVIAVIVLIVRTRRSV